MLNYNKGVLIHKIMSGKVPPSLTAKLSLNQSRHSGKLNIPIPRTDLFKSSRVYSGSVLWNSLPDSLRLPPSTETFKSRYMSYIMRWLVGIACYIDDCYPPETFYHTVSPIYYAFTHQIFATDDFIAPCVRPHSCLSHIMFDVWTSLIPCVYRRVVA